MFLMIKTIDNKIFTSSDISLSSIKVSAIVSGLFNLKSLNN